MRVLSYVVRSNWTIPVLTVFIGVAVIAFRVMGQTENPSPGSVTRNELFTWIIIAAAFGSLGLGISRMIFSRGQTSGGHEMAIASLTANLAALTTKQDKDVTAIYLRIENIADELRKDMSERHRRLRGTLDNHGKALAILLITVPLDDIGDAARAFAGVDNIDDLKKKLLRASEEER